MASEEKRRRRTDAELAANTSSQTQPVQQQRPGRQTVLRSGVASMEQMEQLLPRERQGPLMQFAQIRGDFYGNGEGVNCTKFGQFILRKIIKIVATCRSHMLRLYNAPNSISTGAPPQTPLGELTARAPDL